MPNPLVWTCEYEDCGRADLLCDPDCTCGLAYKGKVEEYLEKVTPVEVSGDRVTFEEYRCVDKVVTGGREEVVPKEKLL